MDIKNDSALLEQLRRGDNKSFAFLYKDCFSLINSYVTSNRGNREDAEDIFQEASIVLLHKIKQSDFILTSSLKTYLYAIAKNLWLKKIRDTKEINTNSTDFLENSPSDFCEVSNESDTVEKVTTWLTKITLNCQRILKGLFFYNESMESLMRKMGWKNKHTAANQKYKCIQQMKEKSKREIKY